MVCYVRNNILGHAIADIFSSHILQQKIARCAIDINTVAIAYSSKTWSV